MMIKIGMGNLFVMMRPYNISSDDQKDDDKDYGNNVRYLPSLTQDCLLGQAMMDSLGLGDHTNDNQNE